MKKIISYILVMSLVAICITSCGGKPESVKNLQHKIDKALESNEPSYDDIIEIINEYDGLLKEEQAMITNYDKIEEKNKIDANVVSCIFAANKLRAMLKNPNSLKLYSAKCYDDKVMVSIDLEYSAENNVGGTLEDHYYCLIDPPIENNGEWSCKLTDFFAAEYKLDVIKGELDDIGGRSSQKTAKDLYEISKDRAVTVNANQIMDNIDMPITEIK